MMVFNPVAVYGVYLGWQEYEAMFNACFYTGLVWLPFLWVAFEYMQNVIAPGGATHHAADHATKHFISKIIMMLMACIVFVTPMITLSIQGVSYKPRCAPQTTPESKIKDTGTTLDDVFADVVVDSVKVPAGFIVAQKLSSGFTYGLMNTAQCSSSLPNLLNDSVAYKLPPKLRNEAKEFHNQCYLEAKTKFNQEKPELNTYQETMRSFGGEDDLNWLGSHTFRTLYYAKMRSTKPVPGFSYASNPSPNFKEAIDSKAVDASDLPQDGFPTCEDWWIKLREKIVMVANDTSAYDEHLGKASAYVRAKQFFAKFSLPYATKMGADDFIAKTLLSYRDDAQVSNFSDLIYTGDNAGQKFMAKAMMDFSNGFKSAIKNPVEREGLIQGLPVYQAMGYFLFCFFAPLILIIGGYRFSVCFSLSTVLFFITLLSYIWLKVGMFEQAVLSAYGDSGVMRTFHNIMTLIYVSAPVFLLSLASITGVKLGGAVDNLMNQGGSSSMNSGSSSLLGAVARRLGGK